MKIVHFCAGLGENNGMANTARQFMLEELASGNQSIVTNEISKIVQGLTVVMIHGAWLPLLWNAAKRAKMVGAKLVIRPAGSYDPVRLAFHGWKKRLVSFFEHRMLRRADMILATCEAERGWIQEYLGKRCPAVEVTDIKRFFKINSEFKVQRFELKGRPLHLLYLGRRHPLKGVKYLEEAVKRIQSLELGGQSVTNDNNFQLQALNYKFDLRIVSNAFGEEKEHVWAWCDVLVLPTLSENFGRVVAEALERGKQVITTDGAPAWGGDSLEFRVQSLEFGGEIWSGYGGRLIYLKGYRDGTSECRIELLRCAIESLVK